MPRLGWPEALPTPRSLHQRCSSLEVEILPLERAHLTRTHSSLGPQPEHRSRVGSQHELTLGRSRRERGLRLGPRRGHQARRRAGRHGTETGRDSFERLIRWCPATWYPGPCDDGCSDDDSAGPRRSPTNISAKLAPLLVWALRMFRPIRHGRMTRRSWSGSWDRTGPCRGPPAESTGTARGLRTGRKRGGGEWAGERRGCYSKIKSYLTRDGSRCRSAPSREAPAFRSTSWFARG
jgi:hypothetical protein